MQVAMWCNKILLVTLLILKILLRNLYYNVYFMHCSLMWTLIYPTCTNTHARFTIHIFNSFSPGSAKSKIDKFSEMAIWGKLTSKQHHGKVPLKNVPIHGVNSQKTLYHSRFHSGSQMVNSTTVKHCSTAFQ